MAPPKDQVVSIGTKPAPETGTAPVPPSLRAIGEVLDITSLNANAGKPARLANLNYGNVVTNTNLGAQNAVSNQQAHSQLAISALGKAVNLVQNLGPLQARSSVDVLTDNAVADEIAGLRASIQGFSGGGRRPLSPDRVKALLQIVRRLLARIQEINAVNARLQGSGTFEDPYRILDQGPLFVAIPITLGFPGVPADQVTFASSAQGVQVGG